jgi:hypothetical protein
MSNLPALIISLISFGAMFFMIAKKWPELRAIEILPHNPLEKSMQGRMRDRIAGLGQNKNIVTEKFLRKLLVKTKILFMKGERRADHYLHRVSHSEKFKDDYWGKMNKS